MSFQSLFPAAGTLGWDRATHLDWARLWSRCAAILALLTGAAHDRPDHAGRSGERTRTAFFGRSKADPGRRARGCPHHSLRDRVAPCAPA